MVFLLGPGEIAEYQDDIAAFVAAGGALYIHQPNSVGTDNCLTEAVHPITAGLADNNLTGVHDQVGALGAGYTDILAESCECGTPSLAIGAHGDGVVAFDAGDLAFGSTTSDAYVHQLLGYLCEAGSVGTVLRPASTPLLSRPGPPQCAGAHFTRSRSSLIDDAVQPERRGCTAPNHKATGLEVTPRRAPAVAGAPRSELINA